MSQLREAFQQTATDTSQKHAMLQEQVATLQELCSALQTGVAALGDEFNAHCVADKVSVLEYSFEKKFQCLKDGATALEQHIQGIDNKLAPVESQFEKLNASIGEIQSDKEKLRTEVQTCKATLRDVEKHQLADMDHRLTGMETSISEVPKILQAALEAQRNMQAVADDVKADVAVKKVATDDAARDVKNSVAASEERVVGEVRSFMMKLEACGIYDCAERFSAVNKQINEFAEQLSMCQEACYLVLNQGESTLPS